MAARALLERWRVTAPFVVDGESARKFNAVYPVVAHTMAQVAASLTLRDQGLVYAARVNVRVALEHALVAQWVVHTHQGEDALIGSMSRLHRNTVRDLSEGGAVIPPELQADLNHPLGEPQLKVEVIADRFDGGTKSIYGLYRHLTGAVHVSLATLAAYIKWQGEDQNTALRVSAESDADPEQVLALAWSAVLALSAVERLRSGQPYLAAVHKLAQDHELVPDLGPFDSSPELQRQPSAQSEV